MTILKKLLIGGGLTATASIIFLNLFQNCDLISQVWTCKARELTKIDLIKRDEQIKHLKNGHRYDVVVIGGGATGAGCALDAVTRGLDTALIEMDDFASGTSSRSTKLIHGGVRYLQAAVMNLDWDQFKMVLEACYERAGMLKTSPNLCHPLPILLPIYKLWQIPYFWMGIKMYDLVAGFRNIKQSYFISKRTVVEMFPMIKATGLKGGLVYYDGQMNDARMNLTIALTAGRYGATVVNHLKVVGLEKTGEIISGVVVQDEFTQEQWSINTKCVINATGPMIDTIRAMDDENIQPLAVASAGTHVILPKYFCPENMGLLDPDTSDGRVIFFLPWQNGTLVGTTDAPAEITHRPAASEAEINFILNEIKDYFNDDIVVRRSDVLSAWSGLRPLVQDPSKTDTKSLVRNHLVLVSKSKLVTIAGGKWTTYRSMAEEAVNAAIRACKLKPARPHSITRRIIMDGGDNWTTTSYFHLVQNYQLDLDVAKHISQVYGSRAIELAAQQRNDNSTCVKRLHPNYPFIEEQIRYGVRNEYACTVVDMIARRIPFAFVDANAALSVLPRAIDIMAEELNWSAAEKNQQQQLGEEYLSHEMGTNVIQKRTKPICPQDVSSEFVQLFSILDRNHTGFISIDELKQSIQVIENDKLTDDEWNQIVNVIEIEKHGKLNFIEFTQVISAIQLGVNVFLKQKQAENIKMLNEMEQLKQPISVDISGGGV